MVELIFPSNPEPGERFDRWQWDGEKWVLVAISGFAPLFSPNFSGMPTAPTPPPGSDDAKIATTAFVMHAISSHTAGVSSFNGRSGHVLLNIIDIFEAGGAPIFSPHFTGWPEAETAPPGTRSHIIATTAFVYEAIFERLEHIVESWNGRTGDVELRWDDVEDVGGAPLRDPNFLGWPRAQTAPRNDSSTRLANTQFVGRALDDLQDEIEEEFEHSVRSWNQRVGHVVLRQTDLSAVDGALLDSPHFRGRPTAPTAPPHTNSDQLATTRYVDDSIRSNPGPPGERGPRGPEGPQGEPGRGLTVVGHVNFVYQLPTHDNLIGDIWTVGPLDIGYWWDGDRWISLGEIRGPTGPVGPVGPQGPIGGNAHIGITPPFPTTNGQFWYEPDLNILSIRDGVDWDQISPPLPRVRFVITSDIVISPYDELIDVRGFAGTRTLTLPLGSSVPIGKTFLIRFRLNAGTFLRIVPSGTDAFAILSSTTLADGSGNIVTNYGSVPGGASFRSPLYNTHGEVTVYWDGSGNTWAVTNRGLPIDDVYWKMPGLIPGPVIGTPTNAVLQSDMRWKVPGTTYRVTVTDYTILPTDDVINTGLASIVSNVTFTLPATGLMTLGKTIEIICPNMEAGGSITINRGSPGDLFAPKALNSGLGWFLTNTGPTDSFITISVPFHIRLTARPSIWYVDNFGQTFTLTRTEPFPILVPGISAPPPGTPATAVLHADMTWY